MNAKISQQTFQHTSRQYQKRITAFLKTYISQQQADSEILTAALSYSLLAQGKRIRPLICYGCAKALNIDPKQVDYIAASIEMIHAYSLIHDDLPAMDDDDLRRGQATCHIKYGEAQAILAGDALQCMAFELLAQTPSSATISLKLIKHLASASGIKGMVGGQALDLAAENKTLSLLELKNIHHLKTGAIIRACTQMVGFLSPEITAEQTKALETFGENFGIAFQIIDDVLDVIGDEAKLGKPVGSDAALHKATYPELMGLENSKKAANKHAQLANEALKKLPHDTGYLKQLLDYLIIREN